MAQAVSRRTVTAGASLDHRQFNAGLCWPRDTWTGFSTEYFGCPVSVAIIPPMPNYHLFMYHQTPTVRSVLGIDSGIK
jgi:hypothetical protein